MSDGFEFHVHNDEELPAELLHRARKGGRTSKYRFAEIEPGRYAHIPFGENEPAALTKKVRTAIVVFNKGQEQKGLDKRKFRVFQSDSMGAVVVYRKPATE